MKKLNTGFVKTLNNLGPLLLAVMVCAVGLNALEFQKGILQVEEIAEKWIQLLTGNTQWNFIEELKWKVQPVDRANDTIQNG